MSSQLFTELTAPNGHRFKQPIGLWINNEWRASKSGEKIASINPADETEITSVHAAGPEDVDDAVTAARAAFEGPWRDVPGTQRGKMLFKFADLVEQNRETLAAIESWDSGKPYEIAFSDDVGEIIAVTRYFAGFADKSFGQAIETKPAQLCYTEREPLGVCAQIIPWNYPLGMASWKMAPALAAGNTIIIKAAEQTPLSILFLAELYKEAGFPPGVVNILNGYGKTAGAAMAAHTDVDKIAFTGSTTTAKEIMKLASRNLKNITLESGGKGPLIIFEDADLKSAVKWGHYGIMANAGQICTSNSRILVHESVYDEYIKLFKEKIKETSIVDDPFKSGTFQGPQVSKAQFDRVLAYIESGKSEGATIALGGSPHPINGKGYFIQPTIFTDVKDEMTIYREEIFGPVVCIGSFKTDEEAIRRANDTTFGLGASIFTKDLAKAHKMARKVQAGMVWVNSSNNSDFRVPFGGVKQSGIGRECGQAGIEAYTNIKSVMVTLE